MQKKLRIYIAAGWFSPNTVEILDNLESKLSSREDIDLYSPRRDGIMLPPNQKHDTELRESIFEENISRILEADLVLANIDSRDPYNDPGTIYEIGFAMANNIPVVGFTLSEMNISERFKGILDGFDSLLMGYDELLQFFDSINIIPKKDKSVNSKVLIAGTGNEEVDRKVVSYVMDSGANIRWINEDHNEVYSRIDEIFEDVKYMIAIIDDRKTIVSWMIGQAYARNIPVITYSDFNYMINIMLLVSVHTHLRGTKELKEFLQKVKREGLEAIPKLDISEFNAC